MELIFELTNFIFFASVFRSLVQSQNLADAIMDPEHIYLAILSHQLHQSKRSLLFLHTVFPKLKSGTIKLPLCSLCLLALYHLGFLQKGCRFANDIFRRFLTFRENSLGLFETVRYYQLLNEEAGDVIFIIPSGDIL